VAIVEVCATEARRGISGQSVDGFGHHNPGKRAGEQISGKIALRLAAGRRGGCMVEAHLDIRPAMLCHLAWLEPNGHHSCP
jgi:hypothetical protein